MARGFLEFCERKGLGRKLIQKTSRRWGLLLSALSRLGEVCCPIDISVARWQVIVKFYNSTTLNPNSFKLNSAS